MRNPMRHEPMAFDKADSLGRRAFLSKAGNTALAVPVATSLIISAGATPALAKSPYGKSGHSHKPKSGRHKGWKSGHHKGGKIKKKTGHKSAKR